MLLQEWGSSLRCGGPPRPASPNPAWAGAAARGAPPLHAELSGIPVNGELHGSTDSTAKEFCRGALVHADLEVAGTADDKHRLAGFGFGVMSSQLFDWPDAGEHQKWTVKYGVEFIDVKIGDQVTEAVDLQDGSRPRALTVADGLFGLGSEVVFDRLSEQPGRDASCKMSSYWSKNIPAMKCLANRLQEIL